MQSPPGVGDAQVPPADGTPTQVHLTWGDDPASSVVISWTTTARAVNPRVIARGMGAGERMISAGERTYTDGLSGERVFTYHANLEGLPPDSLCHYAVTADNDPWTKPLRGSREIGLFSR